MKALSFISCLAATAYTAPAVWAAHASESTQASRSDAWLLPLAGLAALLFISRRQGSSSRTDTPPSGPPPQPPAPTPAPPAPLHTAAANTRY